MTTNIRKSVTDLLSELGGIRGEMSIGTETHLRKDIFSFAQKQHLATALFSLDEIAIEPRVLTPIIQSSRSIELAPTDSVSLTVPYIPDWPELAAIYRASTMPLIEALQGGSNIILAGLPGSGKTVALAWLASYMARNDKGLGNLSGLLPLYIHAPDLHLLSDHARVDKSREEPGGEAKNSITEPQLPHYKLQGGIDILEVVIQAISSYVTPLTLTRLPRLIHAAVENQRALLILDRVDELPPAHAGLVTEFLQLFVEKYPKVRVVVAMSYENFAGLPALGFGSLAMAAWDADERNKFLDHWSQQWIKYIAPTEKGASKKVNPHFLKGWLSSDNASLRPLEYTLKVWAAFSGDVLGPDGPSSIEAYIRRMTSQVKNARPGLEQLALQLLIEMDIASNPHDTSRLVSAYSSAQHASAGANPPADTTPPPAQASKHPIIRDIPDMEALASVGFLLGYPGSHYGFSHPIIGGYLAGRALSRNNLANQIQAQPAWISRNLALHYLARFGEVTPLIQYFLKEDDALHRNHLLLARWLQVAPKNRPWRTIILRTLASVLLKEKETLSLAAKIITAMAFSGDEGVSVYFRQLLKSEHPNLRQLAALGCGILADKKASADLNLMLQEESPISIRAASLALGALGDNQSLELLAASLLNGNELVRRSAAEALANNPKEGHPSLRDGAAMEGVLVRRSVIFGLIRIDQPWATKIVENLQLDDKEWVVRNAAIQVFDELNKRSSLAPHPMPDLTETTWLINFANKIGTTVAPGKPGEELVKKALASGSQDEKLSAMDYFRHKCDPETIDLIYKTYKNSTGELHDAAYTVLWLMTASGIELPFE